MLNPEMGKTITKKDRVIIITALKDFRIFFLYTKYKKSGLNKMYNIIDESIAVSICNEAIKRNKLKKQSRPSIIFLLWFVV